MDAHGDAHLSLAAIRVGVHPQVLLRQSIDDFVGPNGREADDRAAKGDQGVIVVGVHDGNGDARV